MKNLKILFSNNGNLIADKFISRNNKITFYAQGIFFSEGFAFVNLCELYECDVIIESGLRFGGSTRMFLNYLDDKIDIITNDLMDPQFKNQIQDTINSIKNEFPNRNWKFYPGDGEQVIIDLIKKYKDSDKKIAILLDGPKYALALKIQKECLEYENVKFVAIHDMGQGPFNRRKHVKEITLPIKELRKIDNFIFSTDSMWYRNNFANNIDDSIHLNKMTPLWIKFKKKYPYGCGLVFCQNPVNELKFLKEDENLYFK